MIDIDQNICKNKVIESIICENIILNVVLVAIAH